MSEDAQERPKTALADRYTIERELGRGGMATVYLAHDLKHDRKVAVKVLHPELAAVLGAERFLNEIRVTANLQHPHILPLHDSGEVEGFVYYVMPYVEGESLRERLKREKELSVEETVEIAKAVASALDYAHRREVIHRDIKPENILLQDGQPVVADFGIALAVSAAGGSRLTETGLSVGTPQYMSPEQAMGDRELDGRSDIYSLGCVAYEMLVGEPPYTGPTAQAIIAKVVTEEAKSVTATRKTVPTHVDLAVLKALAKLPADRFGTASQLGEALADPRWVDTLPTSVLAARPGKAKRRDAALWASVGALASAVALVIVGLALWPRGPGDAPRSGAVHRTSILLPDSAPLAFVGQDPYGAGRRSLALSPDGSTLVYVAHQGATTRLYRRRLDERRATPLPGTEGAYDVFFSPDGREVGFFVGSELKKIALEGGPPTSLATPEDPTQGAHWASDGRILVSAREGRLPVWVASTGGHPRPLAADAFFFRLSELFPDEKWALGHMFYRVLAMLSLETGNQFVITSDGPVPYREARPSHLIFGTHPRYVPSGHLVYLRQDGVLMAVPFDPVGKRTLGDPVPVLEGVRRESSMGYGQYTFSGDGTLVYAAGKSAAIGELVWLDGDGRVDTLDIHPQVFGHFSLSPDGKRLVVIHYPLTTLSEVWLYDLERGLPQKLATPEAVGPVMWWPDGSTLLWSESPFSSDTLTVIRQHLTASLERDTLAVGAMLEDVSPDGQTLAVIWSTHRPGLLLLPDSGRGEPVVVDEDPTAWGPQFSPDGRWLAWTSGRSGGYEVYVTSTSLTGERYQVSAAGGSEPRWSPRGDELVYLDGKRLWAVATPRAEGDRFGAPQLVFEGPKLDVPNRGHDISPDGERILLILGPPEDSVAYLNVVTNWFEELRRLAPER